MKPKELRDLTIDELKEKHKEYKKELYNLRFQHAIGQLSNTARITEVKRTIARILTIMREKETGRDRSSVLS
ncbi:MAG TPA: 50S ribosomal protein L29 [Acetomicrobium flavidum]|uniref:Large ribosomal subunit protein uL29 n=2 Tax=Acetomicrobium TaxID=49894 RepID=I4BV29_ACEMN|nr:50S ribosomal protein L29 [Acetomicrobium mobile]NLG95074.1 50S ribosomal protein L29 [Acetomicrobium flavidum]AFM21136.1 ribosomal protein L29 [Acetomicrobium mobile DSM 13181]SIN64559.1 LSU ribosomal protein L29P [Acetomicrobium flavidum]HOJ82360.1 50S ribosomal protein L29 [Acetomicrobium flavidum]HOP88036.1 50S ribosomal protein L29 [Acetomicrobium flavidum]